jgi:hypothetical protein
MKTLLLFLSLIVATSQAATVRLYFTDPLTNDKDTNAFYITPIGTNVLSSGGVVGRGVTTRYVPASNGYRTNTLAVGHYSITNRSLGSGVVIRVPDSSSLYDYTNILISGYNIFVTITNGDSGTSGALTNNDTRIVVLKNQVVIGSLLGVDDAALTITNGDLVVSSAGTYFGNGSTLTNLHGSNSISAGTISTNRMDATAYAAFVGGGDVTQAGLAAGSYAVAGNGLGITNIINSTATFGRSVKANEFPFTYNTIASNLPIRILVIGDSVYSESIAGLRTALDAWMPRGGFGSIYTEEFSFGVDGVLFAQSGLTEAVPDSHSSMRHFDLTTGQVFTTLGIETYADTLMIQYFADAAAGTMLVETQAQGGAYGTLATINSAIGTGHRTTNFTLAAKEFYRARVTSTGNNFLLNIGLLNKEATASHTWAKQEMSGGITIELITNGAFGNFLTNYNPQLIIVEAKDEQNLWLESANWFRIYATNSDMIYIAPSPNLDAAGFGTVTEQAQQMFRYARSNHNISVFDKYSLFMPTNSTYYKVSDSAHLNREGTQRSSQAFVDWFGLDAAKMSLSRKFPLLTNVVYISPLDARLIASSAFQTTVPELLNEIYWGGSTLWHHGYRMASGAPRNIGAYLPSNFMLGKKTIAVTQRWVTTNAQPIAHHCEVFRLNFSDVARRETIGNAGGAVVSSLTGTNLVTSTRNLFTFTKGYGLDGDSVFLLLGHGGTLTNAIFWMGAKVEAY